MASGETAPLPVGLYLVGTPIGNRGDITFRAVDTLRQVDAVLAEDTRHTRRLLEYYAIETPLVSCHKFNEARRAGWVLERLARGESVALVTDAGMPGISDPGARTVAACREAGFRIEAIPGPSAAITAYALSGLRNSSFLFAGFLPHKRGKRHTRLMELAAAHTAVILYESPHRLLKLLGELNETFGPLCRVVVCRELTKKFEETLTGTPDEIAAHFGERSIRGELTVVVDRAAP